MSEAGIRAIAATDVGQARKHNEDSYLIDPELGLFIVCDGMGGAQRGEVASSLACSVVRESVAAGERTLQLHREHRSSGTTAAVTALLQNAVQRACEEIYEASTALTGDGGRMGTTLDAVLVLGTQAFTAHVGDGRIYLLRGAEGHQVTEDHSLVQQQLREGILTPEQARSARNKNVITRALGVFPSVMVDSLHMDLGTGDALLLCSDGLHSYVGTSDMVKAVEEQVDQSVQVLVDRANARGGRDNITALLVLNDEHKVEQAPEQPEPSTLLAALRRCDLFSFCTYKELVHIAAVCRDRSVPQGVVLFREHDLGEECFIIESGEVEIFRGGATLAVLGTPAYFGEMSFIDSPKRSATVVTRKNSRFLVINRNDFLRLIKTDANLASKLMWRMLHHLSSIVRNTNQLVMGSMTTQELDALELDE